MRRILRVIAAAGTCAVAGLGLAGTAGAEQKEVVIGGTCDRTGPTQVNGVGICPGIQDYYHLVNAKGGIEGYRIKYVEITTNTRCRRAWRRVNARSATAPSR
jgi:branched-chain amino acid transport system substrate-binding protein